jgi:hypothetical protein
VRDGFAYLTSEKGLEVFDVSDRLHPVEVACVPTPYVGSDVAIAGDYAYVADLYAGILVVDIADPTHPFVAGGAGTYGAAGGLCIEGNYVFVSTLANVPSQSKLQIFSIAVDPTFPELVGMADIPDWGFDVAVNGTHAFVSCSRSGLAVLDVFDPYKPELVGRVDTPELAIGVEASGNYAYVADETTVQVVDVENPSHPRIVGGVAVPSQAWSVIDRGPYLCVGDWGGGMLLIDKTDPTQPKIVGHVANAGLVFVIALDSDLAYVVGWDNLQIVSLGTDPTDVAMQNLDTSGYADGVALQGPYAYIADGPSGFEVAQFSGVAKPFIVGQVNLSGFAQDVVVRGPRAYVAAGDGGFYVIDISHPAHPTVAGSLPLPGYAMQVALDSGRPRTSAIPEYAYVSDWGALQVIRLTGDHPTLVATLPISGQVEGVVAYQDYAYVAVTQLGMVVVNISDPANLHIVATLAFPERTSAVAMYGSQVCAFHGDFLSVVDVSDPANPVVRGSVGVRRGMFLTVSGDYAYVCTLENGVWVVDLSAPDLPIVIGQLDTPGRAYDCALQGCDLVIADQISGIEIAPAQQTFLSRHMIVARTDGALPRLTLYPSSPNPTSAGTIVRFVTAAAANVDLRVFDLAGRCVRSLARGDVTPGEHITGWNGRDDLGRALPGGTYFVRLRCGEIRATDRVILLR